MAKKSTRAELEIRTQLIYTLVCRGANYQDIVKYCKDELSVTSSRTIAKYINAARKMIYDAKIEETETYRKEANARLDECYRMAANSYVIS